MNNIDSTIPKTQAALRAAHENASDNAVIRYAQCWEDADVLLKALSIQNGAHCLSIASAGDNTLAMLTQAPHSIIAIDPNPAQLACLKLRIAAYRSLEYDDLMMFLGVRPSDTRLQLYQRCRKALGIRERAFWDARPLAISQGLITLGRFEHYFAIFRRHVLPRIHSRQRIDELMQAKSYDARKAFYDHKWNNWRWRLIYRIFFSRALMSRLGRDRQCFSQVKGKVASRLMARTHHALTELDPAHNPYLHWIVYGHYGETLPYALRAEHFETIRNNLDRIHCIQTTLSDYLALHQGACFDAFNLSDIFEYLPMNKYEINLRQLISASNTGARIVYWNMLATRTRPASLSGMLKPLDELGSRLHAQDNAFFYKQLVIEEVCR